MPLKILSIATTHPRAPGDSEPSYVLNVNRELVQLGHRVVTVLPHACGAAIVEQVEGVTLRRFRYFVPAGLQKLCYDGGILPNLRRSWIARINLPFFLAAQAAAVARAVHRMDPDIVHGHWLLSNGLMGALAAGARNRPLVVSAHGSDVYVQNLLFQTANRLVLERCRLCTVNSRGTARRVRSIHPGAPIEIVPMGVYPEDYGQHLASAETRDRMGAGQPQILFVGRFSRQKGIDHLIAAMPTIVSQLPNARLGLIGFGPERRRLEREIAAAGLNGTVTIVGAVPREEIPGWFASADLVVLPSVKVEGLGVVLLEALASGTPVVGTNVGGIPDIIQDSETGLLCRSEDPADLARAALQLLTNEHLRQRTIDNGRRLVEDRFSWPTIARKLELLFRSCCADRRSVARGAGPR